MARQSERLVSGLQMFMETYMKKIFDMCCEKFNFWNRTSAYTGALRCIPVFNQTVQMEDYHRVRQTIPDFPEMFCSVYGSYVSETSGVDFDPEDTVPHCIFFLNGFLSHIAEKLLQRQQAISILELVSETDRRALTQHAVTSALEKTSTHFFRDHKRRAPVAARRHIFAARPPISDLEPVSRSDSGKSAVSVQHTEEQRAPDARERQSPVAPVSVVPDRSVATALVRSGTARPGTELPEVLEPPKLPVNVLTTDDDFLSRVTVDADEDIITSDDSISVIGTSKEPTKFELSLRDALPAAKEDGESGVSLARAPPPGPRVAGEKKISKELLERLQESLVAGSRKILASDLDDSRTVFTDVYSQV